MKYHFPLLLGAVILTSCSAAEPLIVNENQIVVEAVSVGEAAGVAKRECARFGREPYLGTVRKSTYFFACLIPERETENADEVPVGKDAGETPEIYGELQLSQPAASNREAVSDKLPGAEQDAKAAPPPDRGIAAGYWVQVFADKNKAATRRKGERLQYRYPDLLASHALVIVPADLARTGKIYRARFGAFDEKTAAMGLCSELKTRGHDCFIARTRSRDVAERRDD